MAELLKTLTKREGLESAPIFAFGASSGGAFMPILAQQTNLSGIVVQIMAVFPEMFDKPVPSGRFPPTVFVHMARDRHTAEMVKKDMQKLQELNVPHKEFQINPASISSTFFSDRIDGVTPAMSECLRDALKSGRHLDDSDRVLQNPRDPDFDWRSAFHKGCPDACLSDSLEADRLPLSEVMNVAYAAHELVADSIVEVLQWLEHPVREGVVDP